jgi:hypothetical protein
VSVPQFVASLLQLRFTQLSHAPLFPAQPELPDEVLVLVAADVLVDTVEPPVPAGLVELPPQAMTKRSAEPTMWRGFAPSRRTMPGTLAFALPSPSGKLRRPHAGALCRGG